VRISIIAAAARNNVIGRDNQLPWQLPEDLRYFKQVTLGKPVVMGRKTFESIGRPLPGRLNIVISRQPDWRAEGVLVASGLEAALQLAEREAPETVDELMVIGGAEIYKQALPLASRIYLTRVHEDFEGDALFPAIDEQSWTLISQAPGLSAGGLPYEFQVFERSDH
jgi:dihydrofolate reductase